MKYTVHTGKHYRASIILDGFESFAGNDEIKSRLERVGFSNVRVWGGDNVRYAEARWDRADVTAELPAQIHQIIELKD